MKNFWSDKKVVVTGGSGFIGSYVAEELLKRNARVTIISLTGNKSKIKHIIKDIKFIKTDLREYENALLAIKNNEVVLNLASKVAGIQYNVNHPATMFSDNIVIAQNIIQASHKRNIERILMVSSACVYPGDAKVPTNESLGFVDNPEPTNLGYGWSKRVEELLSKFYSMEHDMKIAIARPYNAYGPRDNFDPQVSHVIPGLIKRINDDENPLIVWGSGNQSRCFIYAKDLAEGLLLLTEKYPMADPVNIASNEEIKIKDLAKLIINLSQKNIKIELDKTKPDGQKRRKPDISKALDKLKFIPNTKLKDGLINTIEWYNKETKK